MRGTVTNPWRPRITAAQLWQLLKLVGAAIALLACAWIVATLWLSL